MNAQPTRRLAEDRHVVRVAAEPRDVALHPPQRRLLVHEAVVARGLIRGLGGQRRVREEAEEAEAVVDRDDDRALLDRAGWGRSRRSRPRPARRRGARPSPGAAWPSWLGLAVLLLRDLAVRRVDVQVQAVLGGGLAPNGDASAGSGCRTGWRRVARASGRPAAAAASADRRPAEPHRESRGTC